MAAIVSAVVVSAGAAIGASALALGTIAGVSIGGIIGAGIAGGLLAEIKGGDFWDGFGTSALGYGVFQGITGPGGGDFSGTGGEYSGSYGGDFAGDAYLNTAGDSFGGVDGASSGYFGEIGAGGGAGIGGVPTELGMGEYSARAPISSVDDFNYGTRGFEGPAPTGDYVPVDAGAPSTMPAAPTVAGAQAQAMSPEMPGVTNQFGATSYPLGANPSEGFTTTTSAPGGPDFTYTPTNQVGSLEGAGSPDNFNFEMPQVEGFKPDYSLGQQSGSNTGSLGSTIGGANTPNTMNTNSGWGLKNMFNTGDTWLNENLGLPKGSTAMLGMQGATSLYDMYNAQKMKDMAAGMQPMSFDEYQNKFGNLAGYKSAGQALGRAGRTGALPVLLARQKANIGNQYTTQYLPNAQARGWNATMAAQNAQSAVPRNLASTLSSLYFLGNRG